MEEGGTNIREEEEEEEDEKKGAISAPEGIKEVSAWSVKELCLYSHSFLGSSLCFRAAAVHSP